MKIKGYQIQATRGQMESWCSCTSDNKQAMESMWESLKASGLFDTAIFVQFGDDWMTTIDRIGERAPDINVTPDEADPKPIVRGHLRLVQ